MLLVLAWFTWLLTVAAITIFPTGSLEPVLVGGTLSVLTAVALYRSRRRPWAILAILFVLLTGLAYLIGRVSPIFVVVLAFLVSAPIALYRGRRRMPQPAAFGIGLAWVVLVGIIWVIPAIQGPTLVCTYTDPSECPQSLEAGDWPEPHSIYAIFPVTSLRIGRDQEFHCHERSWEWWMGAISHTECYTLN